MQTERIRVGLLEDQCVFLESLVALFETVGMEVVARGSDVESLLAQVEQCAPDVMLVDVRLEKPGSEEVGDGLRLIEVLRERHPQVRTLVLSGFRDAPLVERCFQVGASGYLCKLTVSCDEVVSSVRRLAQGERLLPAEFLSGESRPIVVRNERAVLAGRLTAREREVLALVASGADNLQIAARLDITERTVKAHVSNLYRKLGVHNRVEMAMQALQLGIPLASLAPTAVSA